ncbi:hypothetical protein DXA13_10110 [Clostridium sp. AM58-1XD]|nr:hypothetical protein DXA13_10110 [Clostridium sp. AM58-1XD]
MTKKSLFAFICLLMFASTAVRTYGEETTADPPEEDKELQSGSFQYTDEEAGVLYGACKLAGNTF